MAAWSVPALFAALCIAVHYSFLRAASGRLGDTLGALVLETTAALGIATAFALGLRGDPVPTTRNGLLFAALSGLAISGASILLFVAMRKGGAVASTRPGATRPVIWSRSTTSSIPDERRPK